MEKINWDHFNQIRINTEIGLMSGEEKTLTTGEIRIINGLLEKIKNDTEFVLFKFNEARKRYETRRYSELS